MGILAILILLLAVAAMGIYFDRSITGTGRLIDHLDHRGRVLLLGRSDLQPLAGDGTEMLDPDAAPKVMAALRGSEPAALVRAMERADIEGIVIDGRNGGSAKPSASLSERLAGYDFIPGLRGVYVAPTAGLYVREAQVALSPSEKEALARVARGILEGHRPPRLQSFPRALREIGSVEVMVMLRSGEKSRLWRSARASSIAQGLLTAAGVARQRWKERQSAMGGSLERALPELDVEIALLREDGTVAARGGRFFDRAMTKVHGIGFEQKGRWRYLLPDAARAVGPGSDAFAQLFRDNGMEPEAMRRPDVRLYRFVVQVLARSPASVGPPPGDSPAAGSASE